MDAKQSRIGEVLDADNPGTPLSKKFKHESSEPDDDAPIFNLWAALVSHADVIFRLSTRFLEPKTFCTLYTISKPFHYLVNGNYTAYMLASARVWASFPNASPLTVIDDDGDDLSSSTSSTSTSASAHSTATGTTYETLLEISPFTSYKHLCITDPSHRGRPANFLHPLLLVTRPEAPNDPPSYARLIPTFRYLFLLTHRARTIRSIIHAVTKHYAHPLPVPEMAPVLAKLWYTLDIPTNAVRIALWHNPRFWSDEDVRLALLFFVKLDLCFTDPVDGMGQTTFRKMVLGQRSLSCLGRVLKRNEGRSPLEVARLWVRWAEPEWLAEMKEEGVEGQGLSVLGVPADKVGAAGCEGWIAGAERLIGLEDLCLMEGLKRGLDLDELLVDMMLWGYVEKEQETLKALEDMELAGNNNERSEEASKDGANIGDAA